MQSSKVIALALLVALTSAVKRGPFVLQASPIQKVVDLLNDLKNKIKTDTRMEQTSYDRYACWCEDTMRRKAKDINTAEAHISELSQEILKLSGEFGVHNANVAQLKKEIAENIASTKEATENRNNEHEEYEKDKSESEQCIGGLEFAIKTLTGAGTFLQQPMNEAKLLGAAEGLRVLLRLPETKLSMLSDSDLEAVKAFVSSPRQFIGQKKESGSALVQNPFGDYAPQSTQIQGILKSMYDSLTTDLEKADSEEANHQKSFEALKATKTEELNSLSAKLQSEELNTAKTEKRMSDAKTDRADTDKQMHDDKKFFKETKAGCQTKAKDWAQRVNLRTQEQLGINEALQLFTDGSGDAKQIFSASHSKHHNVRRRSFSLLQSSIVTQQTNAAATTETLRRNAAFSRLHDLAARYRSFAMAGIAADLKLAGHFDKVIDEINDMIKVLREEEQDDIQHRDRCESKQSKNKHMLEDLAEDIQKTDDSVEALNARKGALTREITALESQIKMTNQDIDELTRQRDEESKEFKQSVADDEQSVNIMEQALNSLSKFYTDNQLSLLQQVPEQPVREYTVNQDDAPELTYDRPGKGGKNYKGSDETTNILSLIKDIQEDTRNEIKAAKKEDADARENFMESKNALLDTRDSQDNSRVAAMTELSETNDKLADAAQERAQLVDDQNNQNELKDTLDQDCAWVASHFQDRRTKRKAELEGLQEAKDFLAGVAQPDAQAAE